MYLLTTYTYVNRITMIKKQSQTARTPTTTDTQTEEGMQAKAVKSATERIPARFQSAYGKYSITRYEKF